MAHDRALTKVMHMLKDDTQFDKQFVENESFKRFVGDNGARAHERVIGDGGA